MGSHRSMPGRCRPTRRPDRRREACLIPATPLENTTRRSPHEIHCPPVACFSAGVRAGNGRAARYHRDARASARRRRRFRPRTGDRCRPRDPAPGRRRRRCQGGNAFDAAVAVSSTLSVVEPISSGLGGGGFFLLHDAKTGKDVFVDARETAPAAATPEAYLLENGDFNRDRATTGPWSAGIPGLPAALVHVSEKYGKLPLAQSLAPAIRIAKEGFPVYARLVSGYAAKGDVMERYPGTRAVYLAN